MKALADWHTANVAGSAPSHDSTAFSFDAHKQKPPVQPVWIVCRGPHPLVDVGGGATVQLPAAARSGVCLLLVLRRPRRRVALYSRKERVKRESQRALVTCMPLPLPVVDKTKAGEQVRARLPFLPVPCVAVQPRGRRWPGSDTLVGLCEVQVADGVACACSVSHRPAEPSLHRKASFAVALSASPLKLWRHEHAVTGAAGPCLAQRRERW